MIVGNGKQGQVQKEEKGWGRGKREKEESASNVNLWDPGTLQN